MSYALVATSLLLMLASGCSQGRARANKIVDAAVSQARSSEPTHYLAEWFSLGAARCRLLQVERALTEPSRPEPERVAEDIYVVDARLACEEDARAIPARSVLAHAERVAWLDDRAQLHPLSMRTALGGQLSDEHLLFEVGSRDEGLLFPRSYDVVSGDPVGARERRRARLLIDSAHGQLAVAPWPRGHDRALDLLLDRLARTLATAAPFDTLSETPEAHEGIQTATELYARALAHLAPRQLTVRALDSERPAPRVTLALEQSSSMPLVSFSFELTADRAHPSIARLFDEAEARAAIECSETRSELAARALLARQQEPDRELCNALATLLPGPCSRADPALLRAALEVGTRCTTRANLRPSSAPAPSDFAVRLQRGRSLTNLDPAPRYTLSIERSGRVTFRGEQWVSSRPSGEGQSSAALIAMLYGEIVRMRFLERPGRMDGAQCKLGDERGDTLFVRAGGRERSVRDRDGCRGPFMPEELALLRQGLEQVTAASAWTTPDANPREHDPDIWIIAAE